MKKITLIIVDCQYDFIEGTMAVKGAKECVDNIVSFINTHKEDIDCAVFTQDWHPIKHCSFKENGGGWPMHCVNNTSGAGIDFKLIEAVESNNIPYNIVLKGTNPKKEQYGAFDNALLLNKSDFLSFSGTLIYTKDDIIVCGIAGDYCVLESTKNLIKAGLKPEMLLSGIASIDDGTTIKNFIKENNLEVVELYEEFSYYRP